MSAWGISDEFIGLVREPILGTILSFQDGILHQQAEAMGNYLALLVADADLCSIGSSANIYLEMSRRLIMEMAGKTNLSSEEWKNGWAGQVKFQTGRKFLTIEANTLWGENLQNNLKTAIKLAK
ncbi:MAG: hypothetical protein ACD_61C00254G0001 [uncultured bacterium]|nr:MAG: hypothetical protein ACD_61C00254G0001 [uncultured bacterium]